MERHQSGLRILYIKQMQEQKITLCFNISYGRHLEARQSEILTGSTFSWRLSFLISLVPLCFSLWRKNLVEKTPSGVLTTSTLSGSGVLQGQRTGVSKKKKKTLEENCQISQIITGEKRTGHPKITWVSFIRFLFILPIFYCNLRSAPEQSCI